MTSSLSPSQTLPLLKDLNNMHYDQVNLLLLRCLFTSDLSFHYMMYSYQAVGDILNHCVYNIEEPFLTKEEQIEFDSYIQELRDYLGRNTWSDS